LREQKGKVVTRLDQIVRWLGGEETEGCILFDEAHKVSATLRHRWRCCCRPVVVVVVVSDDAAAVDACAVVFILTSTSRYSISS